MSNQSRITHVVHLVTDAPDAEALAARMHGALTGDTYRVPVKQPLAGVAVGARARLVLYLANGAVGWAAEGIVAAKVDGRSLSIWRDGASVDGPVAARLTELARDWDVTTQPSHASAERWSDARSTAQPQGSEPDTSGWDEETDVRGDAADVSFAPHTLELPLDFALAESP